MLPDLGVNISYISKREHNFIRGRDFGSTVEVIAGLDGSESIVVNPSDSLANGQAVTVAPAAARRQQP